MSPAQDLQPKNEIHLFLKNGSYHRQSICVFGRLLDNAVQEKSHTFDRDPFDAAVERAWKGIEPSVGEE